MFYIIYKKFTIKKLIIKQIYTIKIKIYNINKLFNYF